MTIGVYVPLQANRSAGNVIVETIFPLLEISPAQKLILIVDDRADLRIKLDKTEIKTIKPQPRNIFLKKLWIERSLMGLIKKNKADLFISADNFCSLKTSLPQILLLANSQKLKLSYARKVQKLIVWSDSEKQRLTGRLKIDSSKIDVAYPPPNKIYSRVDQEKKEVIKARYADNKEFFLYNSKFQRQEDLISLLKSFSHFKKRQQSSFKLLLDTTAGFSLEESIETYKYRTDVVLLRSNNINEKAMITAAAYAVVLPFNTNEDITGAMNAMQSGVPVITTNDSSIKEIAGDAALYSENEIKSIGEKMMLLYKDENLRAALIEKGEEYVKNFTEEKSSAQLWQTIMKALN